MIPYYVGGNVHQSILNPITFRRVALKHWMAAYAADESPQQINENLNSSNKYLRANAREKLRSLSLNELKYMLKQTGDNSLAHRQIARMMEKKQQ
jgi:hypothetical protein